VFDSWTSTNAATGLSKVVTTNLYEEVAAADYEARREGGRAGGRGREGVFDSWTSTNAATGLSKVVRPPCMKMWRTPITR